MSNKDILNKNSDDLEEIQIDAEPLRFSRWSVFAVLFVSAMMTVLYIQNVMRIDNILADMQSIKKKKEFLKNENEILKTKSNYLQSPERITNIAAEKLGMIKLDSPPELLFRDE